METFLEKIFKTKKLRVDAQKRLVDTVELRERARQKRYASVRNTFEKALQNSNKTNIIAEIKRASPSKGIINNKIDVASLAAGYERGGACSISVLTEEDFFKGSLDDIRAVREAVDIPILRKDFVFDEFQIYEAADVGADAVLLIVAMLDDKDLENLYRLAYAELGLDVLVEVHTIEELERAKHLDAKIIGVNNRDLHSFKVSLDVSRELIKYTRNETLMISESGLQSRDEILELQELGFRGFLIGETLMKSGDAERSLIEMVTG